MTREFFIKQLDDAIANFNALNTLSRYSDMSDIPSAEIMKTISIAKAAITRITGISSEYYKDIESVLKRQYLYDGDKLRLIIGIINALKSDLQNNYLKSLSEIVQSEVFSDYLEMADHLLAEGYKDPSAVLVGSTLEAHLKELCKSKGIDLETSNSKGDLILKKTEVLNADLAKANAYNGAQQKQVTAWLAIRNYAAHGEYAKYTSEEVKLMLMGIRQFILTIR